MRKSSFGLILGLATAATLAPVPAFTQVPMPPPPAHSCTHPGDHPGRLASDRQKSGWEKEAVAFLECLKQLVAAQEAAAKPYTDAARVHIDAGNAAVEEYNKSAKSFKEQQDNARN